MAIAVLKREAICPFRVALTCLIFTPYISLNTYNFIVIQIYAEFFCSNIYSSTEMEPPLGIKQESKGEEVVENILLIDLISKRSETILI